MHKRNSANWVIGELPSRSGGSRSGSSAQPVRSGPQLPRSAWRHTLARYHRPGQVRRPNTGLAAALPLAALCMTALLLLMVVLHRFWPICLSPCIVGAYFLWSRISKIQSPAPTELLAPSKIQAFEALILSQTVILPEQLARSLQEVQNSLELIARSPLQIHLCFDDRNFVSQTMTRYVPDLCSYYQSVTPESAAADRSFQSQCAVIIKQLEKIRGRLAEKANDQLLQHEQFLNQKLSPGATLIMQDELQSRTDAA